MGDGRAPLRRPVPLAGLHPRPDPRTYEAYYDIRYPNHERSAGRPLRISAANAWHREHGAAFGEKSGWERVNWYESQRRRRGRVAATARLGGPALVARDRRRAPRDPRARSRSSTSPRSRSSRSRGRAPPSCSSACATTGSPARSAGSPTPRCSTSAAGSSATSRSPAWPRSGSRSSPGPRSETTTASGSASTCPRTARRTVARRHLGLVMLRGLGAPVRDLLAPLTPARSLKPGLSLHDRARDHGRQRSGPGLAGHLRRRARLGALLPDRVRARPLARSLGSRASRTGSPPPATGRSTRCGSRRATGSGAPT